jgi:AcrR family transcriptional regulator
MPPKTKFSSEDIIETAFSVVRKQGVNALSTRSIAKGLNSSTMPVYSYLKSKKNLEEEVVKKAFELLFNYQTTPRTGDIFLDMGVGYVLFAKEEKYLFRCINDEKHINLQKKYHDNNFELLIGKLSDYPVVEGASKDQIRMFFLQGWTYSHGLANLVNNSFYEDITEKEITDLLMYTGLRYIDGFKAFLKNEKKKNKD